MSKTGPPISQDFNGRPKASAGSGAVVSVNGGVGAIEIIPADASMNIVTSGNQISLSASLATTYVKSLNTLSQDLNLTSTDSSVTITNVGSNINLAVNPTSTGVASLESLTGAIDLTSTGNTVTITKVGQNINLEASGGASGVASLESLTGAIDLTSTGNTVTITTNGQNINLDTGITSVTGSGIATVTPTGTVFNVDVPAPSVTSVTGSGYATVTPSGSVFNVDVPLPTVTNITGSGFATVTNVGTTFNVSVPDSVNNLNGLQGSLQITSEDNSITVNAQGATIDLSVAGGGGGGIPSLNGLGGIPLSLVSSDNSVTIVPNINTIDLSVLDAITGVVSINQQDGEIILGSADNTVTITDTLDGLDFSITDKGGKVNSINNLQGVIGLISSDSSINIESVGQEINITSDPLNKLIPVDPIVIDTTTNFGFYTISSSSPRIIAFRGISDASGNVNYNFVTDKVIPLDADYVLVSKISSVGTGLGASIVGVKTATDIQIKVEPAAAGIELSGIVALFNYKPFVRKTFIFPFAQVPMPQNITISSGGANKFIDSATIYPIDYKMVNNPLGVKMTMFLCGQWTTANVASNVLRGVFANITDDTQYINNGFLFRNGSFDLGTVLPSNTSFVLDNIMMDETKVNHYQMSLSLNPATPIDFVSVGMCVEIEYWGYN